MEYKLKEYIVYDPKTIGEFGVQAKDIKTNQILLFKLNNIYYLDNWKHKVDGEDKKVYKATRFENLEIKLHNFLNLD